MTKAIRQTIAAFSIALIAFTGTFSAFGQKPRRVSQPRVSTQSVRTSSITEANGVATDVSAARRNGPRTSNITEANGVATDVSAARRRSR